MAWSCAEQPSRGRSAPADCRRLAPGLRLDRIGHLADHNPAERKKSAAIFIFCFPLLRQRRTQLHFRSDKFNELCNLTKRKPCTFWPMGSLYRHDQEAPDPLLTPGDPISSQYGGTFVWLPVCLHGHLRGIYEGPNSDNFVLCRGEP